MDPTTTTPGALEEFATASQAVDDRLFRMARSGPGHTPLLELEELIAAREAARIRALPDAETMTALQAADAIDPELRRRAGQAPCTVTPAPHRRCGS